MTAPLPDSPALTALVQTLRERPEVRLVGIAGVPGSGKSTLSAALQARIPGAVVVPMDGYHLPRAVLDAEGLRRRGAACTFDSAAFHRDLEKLRLTRTGFFPAFDHAEQDPRPHAIEVTEQASLVIVEGLYVLLSDWHTEGLFDLTAFVDCDLETALARAAARHVACGLCATDAAAWERIETNDRLNALTILNDGCRERAQVLLPI